MIIIHNKENCCGCSACAERCPKQCIIMEEDGEGFLYPRIDVGRCVKCGRCEKVCPVIHQNRPHKPVRVYAAKNPVEKIQMESSSGGIFSMLAERIIQTGGVVFGARFSERWNVIHDYTETIEGITLFRGSKYSQSVVGDNYIKAELFLKQGRQVLFTGTPCQIAGLHCFLRKSYDNLLTVDVVCHGVPSPLIWRKYLKEFTGGHSIKKIFMRDKSTKWPTYSFRITDGKQNIIYERAADNIYLKGFLANLYLRPACYTCAFRSGKSGSDLTIADYWGIANHHPEFDDPKGVGLVLIHTAKGSEIYRQIGALSVETTYEQALQGNTGIEKSVPRPKYRNEFWANYDSEGLRIIEPICKKMQPSIVRLCLRWGKRYIKRIISRN